MTRSKKDKNDVRTTVSISLTPREKTQLTEAAHAEGLSLSAFLRFAAIKYLK